MLLLGHCAMCGKPLLACKLIVHPWRAPPAPQVEGIFDEVCAEREAVLALMCDVFGNYVVQKLLELGSPKQRGRLAGMLRGSVKHLCTQMYGCRVIQKALEVLCRPLSCISPVDRAGLPIAMANCLTFKYSR